MSAVSPFSSDAAIEGLGEAFLARTLPKAQWTHAAHFAAALWILRARPDIDAPRALPDLIRAYNEATGGENTDHAGYHETITQASLRGAAEMLRHFEGGVPLHEVLGGLLASPLGDKDWLLAYWSREALFSVEARRRWVAPDLQPLPF